jgi:ferredoxin-NADP reductase
MTEIAWQTARITAIVQQTAAIKSFFFAPEKPFRHRPGQHVDVRLVAPDGYTAMRSYSIASAPGLDGVFELAIDHLPEGEVSAFFHEIAEAGDEIEIRGPLGGHFVWQPEDGGPVLLIGGGSGLAPLMAMIRHWHAKASQVPVLLLLSSRTQAEALFLDELLALETASPQFHMRLALTREHAGRAQDFSRRVDAQMLVDVLPLLGEAPRSVFICGSNSFVNAAADAVVASGVPAAVVWTERYGG